MFAQDNINTDARAASYAALILRLGFGGLILAHGLIKLFVFTLAGTAGFFESVGMPGWAAYPVVFGEIAAGLALIAGVWVRAAALALLPILIGALIVHIPAGFLFSNPNGGWEFPAFLVLIAIVQAILGAGAAALKVPSFGATAQLTKA
ncbi:MAG: DoxX family protein [Pseudomonadota bacterium]